ncbi:neuronal acetylcholine receptor subunit alpha-5-like [Saccostrea echinata]|uniref:neuronal acetylcholine receptor subunit alpha-5-like n=1 Tax=Saccostrea echinata TaxID=191078 RepID=UPI002A7FAA1B|nr:neuronal acetylcholine receptor subunit alpha-5-like [Saccostrea echinata]
MLFFRLFIGFLCISLGNSVTRMDLENLQSAIFNSSTSQYLTEVRPEAHTVIRGTLHLLSIAGLDEITGTFSTIISLSLTWNDERLSWNPASHALIKNITVKHNKIWTPSIIARNPVKKITKLGLQESSVVLYNEGTVLLTIDDYLETVCSFDVTHFPFDVQTCSIIFMPWIYRSHEVDFQQTQDDVELSFYSENGMWEILGSETTVEYFTKHSNKYASLKYSFKVKRHPGYFILGIYVPVLMLMLLNSAVFILPTESGERVGYAITCLLSLAVFLTLTSDVLPKTSKPLSILSCFLMLLVLTSALICLMTIVSLWLCHKDENSPMPLCLKRITHFLLCRGQKTKNVDMQVNEKDSMTESVRNSEEMRNMVNKTQQNGKNASLKLTSTRIIRVKSLEKGLIENKSEKNIYSNIGWKQFSEVFNLICFILTISITGTLGFLYVTVAGANL